MTLCAKWDAINQKPYDVMPVEDYRIPSGNGVAPSEWSTRNAHGVYEYVPVDLAAGEGLDGEYWIKAENVIYQRGTVVSAADMQARADAARIEAEAAFRAAEIERKNTPLVFDQPIELPSLVLSSQSQGLGVGVCATDEGDIVTFTYHASPVPEAAEIKRRIAQAVAEHKARKQADKDERDTLKAQLAEARGKLVTVEADSLKAKADIEELKKGKAK